MKLLHQNATPEAFNFFRKIVFSAWFLIVALNPIWELSRLPLIAIEPTGLLLYGLPKAALPILMHPVFLISFYAVTLAAILVVLIRPSHFLGILTCLLLTVHGGLIRSVGQINHAELAILYSAYFVTIFPMLDSLLTPDQKAKINLSAIPLTASVLLMTLTYSYIGIHRIAFATEPIYAPDSMTGWILQRSYERDFFSVPMGRSIEAFPWLNAMLGYGFLIVTLVEILAPLCLVSRKFTILFFLVMIPFHLLTWLLMSILFWENMMLFILFVDSSQWPFLKQLKRVSAAKHA